MTFTWSCCTLPVIHAARDGDYNFDTQNIGTREKEQMKVMSGTCLIPRCGSLSLEFKVYFVHNSARLSKKQNKTKNAEVKRQKSFLVKSH